MDIFKSDVLVLGKLEYLNLRYSQGKENPEGIGIQILGTSARVRAFQVELVKWGRP